MCTRLLCFTEMVSGFSSVLSSAETASPALSSSIEPKAFAPRTISRRSPAGAFSVRRSLISPMNEPTVTCTHHEAGTVIFVVAKALLTSRKESPSGRFVRVRLRRVSPKAVEATAPRNGFSIMAWSICPKAKFAARLFSRFSLRGIFYPRRAICVPLLAFQAPPLRAVRRKRGS